MKLLKIQNLKIKNSSQNESGFTLIEILVASAILIILASGFLGIQYIISQNQVTAWRNYMSVEDANLVVSSLTRELRDARQSDTGAYALITTDDQEIIFYSDIENDGVVERVRYTLTGSDLIKGVVEPSGVPLTYNLANEKSRVVTDIVQNGTSPVFFYYNSDWPTDTVNNPLPAASRISDTRDIKIILRTNPKNNDSGNDFVLESDARLRMLN